MVDEGATRATVAAARPGAGTDPEALEDALERLETVHEELRVAEEALAEQSVHVRELLAEHDAASRARADVFALLPIGVAVTDGYGTVREANAAAADLFGVPLVRLLGKPLVTFVAPDDRRRLRDLVGELDAGAPEARAGVDVVPRGGGPRPVELLGLNTEGGPLRWMLFPQQQPGEAPASRSDDDLHTASALARLAALPVGADDQQRLLAQLSATIRTAVPAATAVSITMGDPTAPDRLAADSAEAQRLDGLQYRAGEGPCADAYTLQTVVVTADVATDPRWPRLAAGARSAGMRAVLAIPVRLADQRAGVVNVYASGATPLPGRSLEVGGMVAAAVAAVLQGAAERASLQALVHHLERALESRALIEQAKGVVLARNGGTAEEGFARMARWSTRNNVKLREVARRIVDAGDTAVLPGF